MATITLFTSHSQDTALNYDSILENIRYGRPSASDEEVITAATMARLHDTVAQLPDGYHTVVGERGLKLSGGEKQRVAIARAFLRSPRLLVCGGCRAGAAAGAGREGRRRGARWAAVRDGGPSGPCGGRGMCTGNARALWASGRRQEVLVWAAGLRQGAVRCG